PLVHGFHLFRQRDAAFHAGIRRNRPGTATYSPSQPATTARASSTPSFDSAENACTPIPPPEDSSSRRTASTAAVAAPRESLSALVSRTCAGRPRRTA